MSTPEKSQEHKHSCLIGQDRSKSCKGSYLCDAPAGDHEDCKLSYLPEICSNYECKLIHRLDQMKEELDSVKNERDKLKAISRNQAVLLLGPVMAQKFLEKGEFTVSGIQAQINQVKPSWDQVDPSTTGLFFVEYHQKLAENWAQFVHEKVGKVKIKAEIIEKREQETKEFKTKVIQEEWQKTPYGKAVSGYLKLKMPVEQAEKIVQSMGLMPEIKCRDCGVKIEKKQDEILFASKVYLCEKHRGKE